MLEIRKIVSSEKEIIEKITDIHIKTFEGFFLTFMGKGFLKVMYQSYCDYENADILVAFKDNSPIGFLAYSSNMSGLYKYMIKKKLIYFAWYSLGAFFRKPTVFFRLVRAFLKPGESKREEEYVELASIGVDPKMKSSGIGTKLITALKDEVDFEKYVYISLETDAENNEAANHFYRKNGFCIERELMTRESRRMYEYRYK